MDSSTLTHVAAILVGVLVTLVLVGSFQKKDTNSASAAASNSQQAKSATTTPGATGKSKNKKKKKKSKGNGSGAAATGSVNNSIVEEKKDSSGPEEDSKSRSLAAGTTNQQTSTPKEVADDSMNNKKSKKKKKPKNSNKGQDNNNKSSNASQKATSKENVSTKANDSSNKSTTSAKPAEGSLYSQMLAAQTQPPKPKEEEWIVEGAKNKKKNRGQRAKAASSSATTSANAAAAAAAAPATESVVVDAKKIGIIIGPKGATMKAIEEATGCKLDVNAPAKDGPPGKGPQKATVVLSGGDREAMAKAKKAVNELASKGYATLLQSDSTFGEFSITVHPRYLSEIVGPGGRTIQALQNGLDVKLTIPSTDWKPNTVQVGQVKLCKVGIAGAKENSKQAKQVIQSLMKYHHHEMTHPGLVHERVYVEPEFFHCIIGPRGSEIKHIKGNFKVEVYMPNADSETEDVLVVGKQSNVDRAIAHISNLVDRDTERREKRYNDEFY